MRKLTVKQQRFVSEYLIDLNATQAAIRAGYSEKNAFRIAYQLLEKTRVQEAIQKKRKEIEKRTEITIDRCLKEYACIAFLDPVRIFEDDGTLKKIQDIPEGARRAFGGLEITALNREDGATGTLSKVKLLNKKDALDSIMRHLGGFAEDKVKHEHSGPNGGPIKIEETRNAIREQLEGNPELLEKLKNAFSS